MKVLCNVHHTLIPFCMSVNTWEAVLISACTKLRWGQGPVGGLVAGEVFEKTYCSDLKDFRVDGVKN